MTQQAFIRSVPPAPAMHAIMPSLSGMPAMPSHLETKVREFVQRVICNALEQPVPRVTAHVRNCIYVFDARRLTRFSAANKYVSFQEAGEEYLIDESLASLETRLLPYGFVKVHRGELININRVRCVRRDTPGMEVQLDDGQIVPMSRRLGSSLLRHLAELEPKADSAPQQRTGPRLAASHG